MSFDYRAVCKHPRGFNTEVYTRSPITNPDTGAQIWGEYDTETGEYIRDIADASGEYDRQNAFTISGLQYGKYIEDYNMLESAYSELDLITKAEYLSRQFVAQDGSIIQKPSLAYTTNYIAIRSRSEIYVNNADQLILRQYPINPSRDVSRYTSLLIDQYGNILYSTTNRIGIKSGFTDNTTSGDAGYYEPYNYNNYHSTELPGPIPGVEIEYNSWLSGHSTKAMSDEEGQYIIYETSHFCPPVPGYVYFYQTYSSAKFFSRRFNPRGSETYPYYVNRTNTKSCTPPTVYRYGSGLASYFTVNMSTPVELPVNFGIDTMVLSGNGYIADLTGKQISIAEKTKYESQDLPLEQTETNFVDYDSDGEVELVVKGYWAERINDETNDTEKFFKTDELDGVPQDKLLQGVYLSSNSKTIEEGQPDFTRVMDWQTNFNNEGMLASISTDDLKNTDMYIFRLSDGKLISERIGLSSQDSILGDDKGVDESNTTFFYHIRIHDEFGEIDTVLVREQGYFENWQAASGINPDLHKRESDHLKPGDRVEILAINRATGYTGSVQTIMQSAGGSWRDLSWAIQTIKLMPPNLKVYVKRDYDIKSGLKKGEVIKDQIIGYEGAALASDNIIAIQTEWLKADGTSFPASIDTDGADWGYTGRLAYLSGDEQVADGNSVGIAHFAIRPGKHLQVIQLPNGVQSNQHFYIQVNGESSINKPIFSNNSGKGSADFSSTGEHSGKLAKRPDRFVPFMVQVFDEQITAIQQQAYRKAKAEDPNQEYTKPKPYYRWLYRPEFQYSLYDLNVKDLNRVESNGAVQNILTDDAPVVEPSDEMLALLYDLEITDYVPLDYFNIEEEKELIFAFGEEEVKAKINQNDKIEFTNYEHLASLDPEDYLSVRLYTNNDAGNVLWEYAFGSIELLGDTNRDNKIYADNNPVANSSESASNTNPPDGRNSQDFPMLIWVNDDDDHADVADGKFDGSDVPGSDSPDANDLRVDGMRDLVDFFPLHVNIAAAVNSFSPSFYSYKLREVTGSLNYLIGEDIESDTYIKPFSADIAIQPYSVLKYAPTAGVFKEKPVTNITAEGVELARSFVSNAGSGKSGIIYIEAKEASPIGRPLKLELIIEERATSTVAAKTSIWIQARPVQEMFRHINLQEEAGLNGGDYADGKAFPEYTNPESYPDERNKPDYFVFLHGFNVPGEVARGWHSEVFKRLYRLGFNGRFVGVTWHGAVGTANYHESVYNAFVTSTHLKNRIDNITPEAASLTIAAHSLGNVVVSNAIAHEGLTPTRYYMINAAAPIEAYDPTQLTGDRTQCGDGDNNQMKNCMIEDNWLEFQELGLEKMLSSEWHTLFTTEGDPRQKITWRGMFKKVIDDVNVYNFYSPGEDVVENPNEGGEDVSEIIADNIDSLLNRHAWVNQEIGKGCRNLAFAGFNSPCQAGWAFNYNEDDLKVIGAEHRVQPNSDTLDYRPLSASEASRRFSLPDGHSEKLTDEHIAQYGFFRQFNYSQLYAPIMAGHELKPNGPDRSDVDNLMSQKEPLWQLLASAIPARSFAVAANALTSLIQDDGDNYNINMHLLRDEMKEDEPYWPSERLRDSDLRSDWLHSDVRNIGVFQAPASD